MTNDYLPFYQQLFSYKTNDFNFYIVYILILAITPLILYSVYRVSKLALIFIITIGIGWLAAKYSSYWLPHWEVIMLLTIVSVTGGLIINHIKLPAVNRLWRPLLYAIALVTIFLILFNPKYSLSYENLAWYGRELYHQFHHVNFFIAPINDVLNGKTLLVNAHAQYGILTTYIPAVIFRFIGLSYANFTLYNMLVNIIYSFLIFVFIRQVTRSFTLAFIGVIIYIRVALMRYGADWEAYILPSTTPLRYFFDILIGLSIFNLFKKITRRKLFITSLLIVTAFFYNVEFGIPLLLAYGVVIILDLKRITQYFISLLMATLIVGGFISLMTVWRAGAWPNWLAYFNDILFYTKGFEDVAMPAVDFYWLPLFIYAVTYGVILYKLNKRERTNLHLMVFFLIYGLLIFLYYVNLSEPNHLFTVTHPAILIFFILASQGDALRGWQKTFFIFIIGLFIVPFPNLINEIKSRLEYRYSPINKPYYYWSYKGTNFYLQDNNGVDFYKAADKIQRLTKNTKDIVIISRYDTLLYLMSGKTSLLNHPIAEYEIRTKTAVNQAVNQILTKKPTYIFLYSEKYNQMQIDVLTMIADKLKRDYSLVEPAGVVDIYKSNP